MTDRVRVLFVNGSGILGGAEHSLLLLLQGLQTSHVDAVVAMLADGPLGEELAVRHVPATVISAADRVRKASRYDAPRHPVRGVGLIVAGLPTAFRLARFARKYGSQVIHTNGMKAHMLGGLAGRLAGVPVVWHVRDFPPPGWTGRVFERQAQWLPSLILANSEAVRSSIASRSRHRVPILALKNPVDLERFHPHNVGAAIRRELGVQEPSPLIGLIAHLTPWKGHELFLAIARSVADRLPNARFVLVGGPVYETNGHAGYADALRNRVAALGLADRVVFLGARDDVADVLAALDVLVHCPTAPEPFGRVIAEAMGAGRAIVAARSGGIPELVDDGVTGLLVPPGNVERFVAAILQLTGDAELRRRLGEEGRRRAEAMFDVGRHATSVLTAYRDLLSEPASKTAT
jgi:glycosyltransferase involved in cell wall biosynthesis